MALAQLAGVDELKFKKEIYLSLEQESLENGIAYYLEQDEKIIGTSFLKLTDYDSDSSLTIFHIAVEPNLRGRGLGKILMENTFKIVADYGKKIVILFTTTQSEFYKACGMTELGNIPDMVGGNTRHFFYKKI